jgi:hypothetical protein
MTAIATLGVLDRRPRSQGRRGSLGLGLVAGESLAFLSTTYHQLAVGGCWSRGEGTR